MALHTMNAAITYEDEQAPDVGRFNQVGSTAVRELAAYLEALSSGHRVGTMVVGTDSGNAVAASGTFTFASASGTTTATINGVAFTQSSGTDSARATALASAINGSANALIAGVVTASAVGAVVTVTAAGKGKPGNTNTLAASGTGFTASGNRLTGGADDTTAYTFTR